MKGVNLTTVMVEANRLREQVMPEQPESPNKPDIITVANRQLDTVLAQEFALLPNEGLPDFPVDFKFNIELVKEAKNKLVDRFVFEPVAQKLYQLPLRRQFEPVQVGFGVVVTPESIQKALIVIANATILTTKQIMLQAIVETVQALPCAANDKELFYGVIGRVTAQLLTQLSLLDNEVERLILKPVAASISKQIIERVEDGTNWGVGELERSVAEKILSDDPANLPFWLGYLKAHDFLGSSMLNLSMYELIIKFSG